MMNSPSIELSQIQNHQSRVEVKVKFALSAEFKDLTASFDIR
jgi:hypothetical protein